MAEAQKKRKILDWYFRIPLVWRVLTALVLGIAAGLVFGQNVKVVEPLGTLMLKLLRMVILPLIFFSIVVGVGSTPASKIGRIAGKILSYYIFTTLMAATFGIILGHVFKPGSGANLTGTATSGMEAEPQKISDIFLNMVPDNVVGAFNSGSYLQVLLFAVFFGLAISVLLDSKRTKVKKGVNAVLTFCEGAAEIMFKITQGVLEYTPIGVFALIAVVIADGGFQVMGSLASLIIACYIGYIFQMVFVYGGFLKAFGMPIFKFYRQVKSVLLMAFATRSSNAVLPLNLKNAEERLGVNRTVSGFTLPLGAQINMDGEAYYQMLAVFFVANATGFQLTIGHQILMILAVTLGSIGTAGIAGAGPVVLLAVMEMVGLPATAGTAAAAAFALVLGIDVILDMGRTTTNVCGDIVGTAIVAKTENMIDMSRWDITDKLVLDEDEAQEILEELEETA